MFRRKRKFSFKILLGIGLFVFAIVSFVVGYNSYTPSEDKEVPYAHEGNHQVEDNSAESVGEGDSIYQQEEAEATYQEESIRENTKITYKTFYSICQNTIDETDGPSNEMIGLTEDGLEEYLKTNSLLFDIEAFSTEEVILLQNKTTVCPQHYNYYWVTEEKGNIVIYQFNESGKKVLIEETSLQTSRLPLIDQEKLKQGMLRESIDEVYQLLEDYSG